MAKILIIDDDKDMVASAKVVLEAKGHTIIVAFSGQQGLEKAKEENPELIILDIVMETGTKGVWLAKELKAEEMLKNIPILMMTSIKEETGISFKKEAGDPYWLPVEDYCEKPLSPDQLISKVEKLLKG